MATLYPYSVRITRSTPNDAVGIQPYKGRTTETETVIVASAQASIQESGNGSSGPENLPTDGRKGEWNIFIPKRAVAKGVIRQGDFVWDDTGRKFHVVNDYWNILGWKLRCARLKV